MREEKRLVLDANILLRAVFGVRVCTLLEKYEGTVSFYAPEVCFADARAYIPVIASTRHVNALAGLLVLDQLTRLVEVVDRSLYETHEFQARERMRSRDIADWPIAATSFLLDCGVWTEDQDFFGSGIATWTTRNVELYLRDT
jgi:predicted nucleic acid-binding protein